MSMRVPVPPPAFNASGEEVTSSHPSGPQSAPIGVASSIVLAPVRWPGGGRWLDAEVARRPCLLHHLGLFVVFRLATFRLWQRRHRCLNDVERQLVVLHCHL